MYIPVDKILRRFTLLLTSLVVACTLFVFQPSATKAASPIVAVGNWNAAFQCPGNPVQGRIETYLGSYDIDTYTRDSLAGEVFSFWSVEGIKANAVMIRTMAMYFYQSPESNYLCNITGRTINLRTTRIQGWQVGLGATDKGIASNIPNDRVTDTGGRVITRNGQVPLLEFLDCGQTYTQDARFQGRSYIQILTDADGVFGPNRTIAASCATLSNTLIVSSLYSFSSSMTNGTAPYALTNGTQTTGSTTAGSARQAESYYGFSGMDAVISNPFNQPERYIVGYQRGDKTEYRMDFGGAYQYLYLIGIADRPSPVEMNIYIDGYYKRKLYWSNNDNARHLVVGPISGITFGTHAIAIEFVNDAITCTPSTLADCDRNFYFDVLAALNVP